MNIDEIVRSRAYRILRRLTRYRELSEAQLQALPDIRKELVDNWEKILGIYENQPGQLRGNILVTTEGLHIFLEEEEFVPFDQIDHIKPLNEDDKSNVEELIISYKSGKNVRVPIIGGNDKFRDAWEVFHFLDRVVSDYQKKDSSA